MFPAAHVERQITPELDKKLKGIEGLAKKGKVQAALSETKIKEAHAKGEEEEFALYFYKHALKLLTGHQYLFDD